MNDIEPKVVGVLVAYNTPRDTLQRTAARLSPQLFRLLIMDNSDTGSEVEGAFEDRRIAGVDYLSSGGNIGIANAQNHGITRSIELGADYVFFLDDDSGFPDGGVEVMIRELENERRTHPQTVGIGPQIVDQRTGKPLIAVWDGIRIRPGTVTQITEVAYLVSSGALIDVRAFEKYGQFRGEYFIDHVDQEWGLRVGLAGGRLVVTGKVTMAHELGDAPSVSRRGSVRYNHASPTRDYYLTRNAILYMRDLKFPPSRYLGFIRMLAESALRKIFGRGRNLAQRYAVVLGLVHGLTNRRGRR
jgi:rhamnosyltransferase